MLGVLPICSTHPICFKQSRAEQIEGVGAKAASKEEEGALGPLTHLAFWLGGHKRGGSKQSCSPHI